MLEVISSELSVDLVAAHVLPDIFLAGLHRIVDGEGFTIIRNWNTSSLKLSIYALGMNGDEKRGEAK